LRAAAFLRYLQRWSEARSSAVATGGSALVAAGTVVLKGSGGWVRCWIHKEEWRWKGGGVERIGRGESLRRSR